MTDGTIFEFDPQIFDYVYFGFVSDVPIMSFSAIGNGGTELFPSFGVSIDDLHVSFARPAQLTEPATFGMLAIGSLVALARRRRSIRDARSVPGE